MSFNSNKRDNKHNDRNEVECYNCHEKGHIAPNCPKLNNKNKQTNNFNNGNNDNDDDKGKCNGDSNGTEQQFFNMSNNNEPKNSRLQFLSVNFHGNTRTSVNEDNLRDWILLKNSLQQIYFATRLY